MISVVGLLGAGAAGSALVIWGTMVRRAMERDGGLAIGAGAMPAGAAQEGS